MHCMYMVFPVLPWMCGMLLCNDAPYLCFAWSVGTQPVTVTPLGGTPTPGAEFVTFDNDTLLELPCILMSARTLPYSLG